MELIIFNGLASGEHVWQKLSLILGSQQRQKIKINFICNVNKKTKDTRNYLQRIESRRKNGKLNLTKMKISIHQMTKE